MQVDKLKQGSEPTKGHARLLHYREVLIKQKLRERLRAQKGNNREKESSQKEAEYEPTSQVPGADRTLISSEVAGSSLRGICPCIVRMEQRVQLLLIMKDKQWREENQEEI